LVEPNGQVKVCDAMENHCSVGGLIDDKHWEGVMCADDSGAVMVCDVCIVEECHVDVSCYVGFCKVIRGRKAAACNCKGFQVGGQGI